MDSDAGGTFRRLSSSSSIARARVAMGFHDIRKVVEAAVDVLYLSLDGVMQSSSVVVRGPGPGRPDPVR